MLLRMMREGDNGGIVKMAVETTEPPVPEEIFKQILASAQTFVLEEEGRLLGFCTYAIAKDGLHIIFMAVEKNAQRKGFGRILLDQAERTALKNGKQHMRLEIRPANRKALIFYRKNGFITISEDAEKLKMQKNAGEDRVQPAGKNGGRSQQSTLSP